MARLKALQEFIIREIFKDAPTGVMRTLPNKELVDMNVQVLAQRLMQGGIDPTALKNANQVENAINMIESRAPVQQGIKSTKSAKVFDMEGKEIKDPKNIVGGKEINQQSLKEELMKTDNPVSDLIKTTEKGPKTLKEREAEILERMNRENKETVQRIRNRKLIQEAIDNVSPGFVKGDKKYNAEIVAEEIANKRGLDYYDMDSKQRLDIYDEAFNALTDMEKKFAQGGRAGYRFGIGPLLKRLSEKSPKKAYTDYLESVKKRAKEGDVKSLAPELGAVSATGVFINRRMKDVLENMKNQDMENNLENFKKELDADPFYKKYPEIKDKMIEGYTEMMFGEKKADGGRAGFANGSEGIMSLDEGAPSILLRPRASGMKREQQIAPGINLSERDINYGISGILQGDKFYGGASLDKGKVKLDVETEDGQTLFKDTIAKDDALNFILGMGDPKGEKDKFQIKFDDDLENMSLVLKKSFAEGGRANFDKGGMSRRQFMKIMGGIASLPFIGKFFKGAKPAAKVAEVATKSMPAQPPEYFFDLAAKIKLLGKESKLGPRERVREIDYKNYTLQEDMTTGDMTIVKRKGDPDFEYQEEVMTLKKGQADETTKGEIPPDEYEEVTVRPEPDTGRLKEVEDGIEPDSVKEIMEEVGKGGGNLDQTTLEEIARGKLASGGVAMMLGE